MDSRCHFSVERQRRCIDVLLTLNRSMLLYVYWWKSKMFPEKLELFYQKYLIHSCWLIISNSSSTSESIFLKGNAVGQGYDEDVAIENCLWKCFL